MEQEVWEEVSIEGFRHRYSVSNAGRVKRLPGRIRFWNRGRWCHKDLPEKILKQQINCCGYFIVSLQSGIGNSKKTLAVAPMVCAAFNGPRTAPDLDCAHLDGNPKNNRATNLAWATKRENEAHKLLHGTRQMGSRHHAAKLCEADVSRIRRKLREGCMGSVLADEYRVARTTISDIKKRHIWRHVA